MRKQREFVLPAGSIYYEIVGDPGQETVRITGGSGPVSLLQIPDLLEGYPVTEIGKKAFLSCKHLREVILPAPLEELGDWAFASCSALEKVVLPGRELRTGRSVFRECGALKYLAIRSAQEEGTGTEIAELQAAAIRFFEAYYLLDPLHAGEEEWMAKWDHRLLSYLHTDDQDGYARQVLCGEEDYGSTDLGAYLNGRRREKTRLVYLRLLNPLGLRKELQEELQGYLLAHTKGCPSEEGWETLLQEHGEERRYYELFARIGCLTEENFGDIMEDIGEDYPEMKAYFLKYKEEQIGYADFFEELSLDW